MGIKTYNIKTLGCKVNQYESNKLRQELSDAGLVYAHQNADIVIINSCAVTKIAVRKVRALVSRSRRDNPGARIFLSGCWPALDPVGAESFGTDIITVFGKKDLPGKLIIRGEKGNEDGSRSIKKHIGQERSRYFIKVQDGCEQFCTYCIIPYVRGKLKSRPQEEILEEIRSAVKAGFREFVLSGIHLGLYGINSSGRRQRRFSTLAELLEKILTIPGLGRIRLSSIEVTEINDELIGLMKNNRKFCRHLHIPLQSGCDKILKLMKRPYTVESFERSIAKIRRAMPEIAVTTDVVAGFPGESDLDYRETCDTIGRIGFSRLHVFPFSAHAITPAAKLPHQVNGKMKQSRAKILRQMSLALEDKYQKRFMGKILPLVLEKCNGKKMIGKTEYYFDIEFDKNMITGNPAYPLKEGNIYRVRSQSQ